VIAYFTQHRTAANLLMLVLLLMGALALPKLQRETYPEFEPSTIRVSASYPGAPAELVDTMIVQRIEDEVSGLTGISRIRSQAREGTASTTIELEDGANFDTVLADVKSAIDGIRDFPAEVEPPTVRGQSRMPGVASIAVTGPMSGQDLQLYCEQLKRELLRYREVSQVSVSGFSIHRLLIRVNRLALVREGLRMSDVATAISSASLDVPIGTLETLDGDIVVRYSDKRTTPEALAEIIIKAGAEGGTVLLGDIADIEDTFAVESQQTFFNGERAGLLSISKTASQDSLSVLAAVKEFLTAEEEKKPDGVTLTLTEDVASVIQDRIDLLLTNGLQGLFLVFFTLWLFFGTRMAFWVAAGLPVSFLGAMWVMLQLNYTLNMMTMMGLLVALGLLMDDGIVLADNVAAHLSRGKRPIQAAVDGVKEVWGGVVSSFITTACIFIPLSSIEGRIGRTLQVIPFVLLAVLAVSLIESFFVLPNHLGHALRPLDAETSGRFRRWFDAGFARFRDNGLGRLVDGAVRYRYLTLGIVLAVLILSIGMVTSGKIKYVAFPNTEGDITQFKLEMSPGTPFERTKQEIDRVVDAAWKVSDALRSSQPNGAPLVRNVSARFNYNPDVEDPGPHVATVSVDLLSVEVRRTTLDEFTTAWRKAVGPLPSAMSASFGAGGRRGPGGNPIEVKIEGDDLSRLKEISDGIQAWFAGFDGVFDLSDDLQSGTEQITLKLLPGASSLAVTGTMVQSQLRGALSGVSIEHLNQQGAEIELFVELDRASRDTVTDIAYFPVIIGPEVSVPLGAIAQIESSRSFARISRVDGIRTATVRGNVNRETVNAAALMSRFRQEKQPELEQQYPEMRFRAGGEAEESAATLGSMGHGLIIGLLGIFVLLSLQFKSYIEPVIVMLAIPFAFVGVVWGYTLIGSPLSSQSLLGLVSLAGVVVNDSILLVMFIKQAHARGLTSVEAACRASRDRFRAVLLTSVTTIAGLVPIMFETSRQAQSLIPIATSIVFGIIASTILVLVVLPPIYAVLADFGILRAVPDREDREQVPQMTE
jgi:hydrophobic/amphiphilic exporter-1 (mainly G- bacteria), HAE1 family